MNARRLACLAAVVLAVAVARADDGPDPIATAKEGEWVLQKVDSEYGGMKITQLLYMWVSRIEGRKITLGLQFLKDDKKHGTQPPFFSPVDLDHREGQGSRKAGPQWTQEEREHGGKKLACWKKEEVTDSPVGKVKTTTWVCKDVPVDGVLRIESVDDKGKPTQTTETIEWGREGGAEKPLD